VEITKRTVPEQNAEAITIHITATPSFDAAARWLLQTNLFPIAPPFLLWADIMRACQPCCPSVQGRLDRCQNRNSDGKLAGGSAGAQPSGRRRAARYGVLRSK
jgi:hypothetical protein